MPVIWPVGVTIVTVVEVYPAIPEGTIDPAFVSERGDPCFSALLEHLGLSGASLKPRTPHELGLPPAAQRSDQNAQSHANNWQRGRFRRGSIRGEKFDLGFAEPVAEIAAIGGAERGGAIGITPRGSWRDRSRRRAFDAGGFEGDLTYAQVEDVLLADEVRRARGQ